MQLHLHQTHQTLGDFKAIAQYLKNNVLIDQANAGVHIFSELFLCGYPLQDWCLSKSFIENYQTHLTGIDREVKALKPRKDIITILGGLHYTFENDTPSKIENCVYLVIPGTGLTPVYTKMLLPNYDIYDEKKYFTPGTEPTVIEFQNKIIALQICEDMWATQSHMIDPVKLLHKKCIKENIELDLIVNLSASPSHLGKHKKRLSRASEISRTFGGVPFVYVNRVAAEDEILFDGQSFVVLNDKVLNQLKPFQNDSLTLPLPPKQGQLPSKLAESKLENTWEYLFNPTIQIEKGSLPKLNDLTESDCEYLIQALGFGLQEYASKCGFKKFLIALSGGLDSALVLALCKITLNPSQSIEAIYMPGQFSSGLSWDLATQMCQKIKVPLKVANIKFPHTTLRGLFRESFKEELTGLSDENIQSRIRGLILYSRSNQTGAMAINTSNKSEIAVGYSTQYGDSVGAISLLGDLYKTEVFQLSQYINKKFEGMIPEGIISRPPTAELRENQEDSQSLPAYERLDPILEGLLSNRYTVNELITSGFSKEEVEKCFRLLNLSEYKRMQFCPIIKVKAKSFGFGYRMPICKKFL